MIARYEQLHRHPGVFRDLTGLTLEEFDHLLGQMLPEYERAEYKRHARADRLRAPGAGRDFALDPRDQLLLTLVWLRRYLTHALLGWLFGVSDSTSVRVVGRILPILARLGRSTMRMPNANQPRCRSFADLL